MLERCHHTDLTVPECSCIACLRAMVEKYAPEVRLGVRPSVAPPEPPMAQVFATR